MVKYKDIKEIFQMIKPFEMIVFIIAGISFILFLYKIYTQKEENEIDIKYKKEIPIILILFLIYIISVPFMDIKKLMQFKVILSIIFIIWIGRYVWLKGAGDNMDHPVFYGIVPLIIYSILPFINKNYCNILSKTMNK